MTVGVSLLLVLSGFASLTYQVVWVRLIGFSLGSTAASISTVVAAFFVGLALGSFLADRFLKGPLHSLWPYAVLELVIGVSGLASVPILLNIDHLLTLTPELGDSLALKFLLSVGLLVIPTTAMGATFPVMAAVLVRRASAMGAPISLLYGFNTVGAVLGAATGGFLLIPRLGLDGAVNAAVGVNVVVALLAAVMSPLVRRAPTDPQPVGDRAQTDDDGWPLSRVLAAVTLLVTGFTSIASQIGWSKFLAVFVGSTIYGFSAILASFLAGVALGSLLVERLIDKIRAPASFMAYSLVVLGLTMLLARAGFSGLPTLQHLLNEGDIDPRRNEQIRYIAVFVLLLPPTFLLGMMLPVNLKIYCGAYGQLHGRIGGAYALNTLASIAGSVAAGFWLIPQFGTDATLSAMALIAVASGLIWLPMLGRMSGQLTLASLVVVAVIAHVSLPHLDYRALVATVGYDSTDPADAEFPFLEEGKAGIISLVTGDGRYLALQTNGLNESSVDLEDPNYTLRIEALLGTVPYLLHNDPSTAFVVGFGSGHTVRSLTRSTLDSIRVVELEPAVVGATMSLPESLRAWMEDDRLRIEFNDARNALLVSNERYDLIVSQPSHPWVSGAANVFTRDFWAIAQSKLNDDGVFGQWVNLFSIDKQTLQSVMKAFYEVFPNGFTIVDGWDMVMIGSAHPLDFDPAKIDAYLEQPEVKKTLGVERVSTWRDIARFYSLSRAQVMAATEDATANTDKNLFTEVRLAKRFRELTDEDEPRPFIRSVETFDLLEWLPNAREEMGSELVDYFAGREDLRRLRLVQKQLKDVAPELAGEALYRVLELENQVSYMTVLMDRDLDWSAHLIVEYVDLMVRVGDLDEALKWTSKIDNQDLRNAARAKIHARAKNWSALRDVQPADELTTLWFAIGMANFDLANSADTLRNVDGLPNDAKLDAARILLRYYSQLNDHDNMRTWARRAARSADRETEFLFAAGSFAIGVDDLKLAQLVVDRMREVDGDSEQFEQLRIALGQKLADENTE